MGLTRKCLPQAVTRLSYYFKQSYRTDCISFLRCHLHKIKSSPEHCDKLQSSRQNPNPDHSLRYRQPAQSSHFRSAHRITNSLCNMPQPSTAGVPSLSFQHNLYYVNYLVQTRRYRLKAYQHSWITPSLHDNKKHCRYAAVSFFRTTYRHGSQIKLCLPKTNHFAFGVL